MKLLATILLKVTPADKLKVRCMLQSQKLHCEEAITASWDFVVKIHEADVNCDVPEDFAIRDVADKLRVLPGVSRINLCTTNPSEDSE